MPPAWRLPRSNRPLDLTFMAAEPAASAPRVAGGAWSEAPMAEDRWPALPEPEPDDEDGWRLLRSWERQRRLDREQLGD